MEDWQDLADLIHEVNYELVEDYGYPKDFMFDYMENPDFWEFLNEWVTEPEMFEYGGTGVDMPEDLPQFLGSWATYGYKGLAEFFGLDSEHDDEQIFKDLIFFLGENEEFFVSFQDYIDSYNLKY